MSKHGEAVKTKLESISKLMEEFKALSAPSDPNQPYVTRGDLEILEDILAILDDLNMRVQLLEADVLPGSAFIDDSEIPHRLK